MDETPAVTDPQTVVVTGGGRGIGAAISRAFYEAGNRVAIVSRTDDGLAKELGDRACHLAADVTRSQEVEAAVARIAEWGTRIDVVVNNAGLSAWRPLAGIDDKFWANMLAVNLSSVLYTCRAAQSRLSPGASIINVSSLAGKRGSANNAAYCAAKFGVNGLTQALAKELGPRGIRVNAICPVYIQTAGLLEALEDSRSPAKGRDVQTYLNEFAATQAALGRLPTGEQVAASCLFLASAASAAITGQCINVDCGVMPQ